MVERRGVIPALEAIPAKAAPKTCDCGQAGVIKDGSGWSCQGCRDMLVRVTAILDAMIRAQRGEQETLAQGPTATERRAERYKTWRMANRSKVLAYQKNYHRRHS